MNKKASFTIVCGSLLVFWNVSGAPIEKATSQQPVKPKPAAGSLLNPMPDLQVLGYRRGKPRGERVEIRVKNFGSAAAGPCHGVASATFKSGLEASPTVRFNIPPLAPGERTDIAVDIMPPPKNQGAYLGENSHVVKIVADARQQVPESNESNNTFEWAEKAQGSSGGGEVYGKDWGK